jgi:F0F1-type ATP synthase membrane subunit a
MFFIFAMLLVPLDLGPAEQKLEAVFTNASNVLTTLGLSVCILGIIVGGLMRATAFGNERKIATSNVALSCAVVGFVIVLLASVLAQGIQGLVG